MVLNYVDSDLCFVAMVQKTRFVSCVFKLMKISIKFCEIIICSSGYVLKADKIEILNLNLSSMPSTWE